MGKSRVLIAKESPAYCDELAEYLRETGIFEVLSFAHDGYAVLKSVATDKPDVLVMDVVLPNMDGVSALKTLNVLNMMEGVRVIAMSPFISEDLVSELEELGAKCVMHLPAEPEKVFNRIVDFAIYDADVKRENESRQKEKRRELTERVVTNYFHVINAPANLLGYQLARAAVIYCVENYDRQSFVTIDVYPHVAELYGTTPKRVERNIRTFIDAAWERGDIEKINKLFGYTVSQHKGRPTNKEFIAMLTERSIMRLRQG